jgi:hypothetical protein
MPLFQRDYILRLIEQVAESVTRAFRFLAQQNTEEAERQLNTGYGALGVDREFLCALDAASIRNHFADEDKLALAVRLLLCDAELHQQRGQEQPARRLVRAARKLVQQIAAPDEALQQELTRVDQRLNG